MIRDMELTFSGTMFDQNKAVAVCPNNEQKIGLKTVMYSSFQ
jgi:hypothetical protein